jgi:predicted HicB family RNase H-like nuclease
MKDYKGYSARVAIDEEQNLIHGEVIGITDVITFQGRTPAELTQAFQDSVDDYLAFCEERGTEPDRPYSGRFVVRVSPGLHRRISALANKAGVSMNDWIVSALERAGEYDPPPAPPLSAPVCGKDVIRT